MSVMRRKRTTSEFLLDLLRFAVVLPCAVAMMLLLAVMLVFAVPCWIVLFAFGILSDAFWSLDGRELAQAVADRFTEDVGRFRDELLDPVADTLHLVREVFVDTFLPGPGED